MFQHIQPDGKESAVVAAAYAAVLARIWVVNPDFMAEFLRGWHQPN